MAKAYFIKTVLLLTGEHGSNIRSIWDSLEKYFTPLGIEIMTMGNLKEIDVEDTIVSRTLEKRLTEKPGDD